MEDLILIAVLAAILTGVIVYIHRQKRRGVKCIGCPDSGTCGGQCGGCSGCGSK